MSAINGVLFQKRAALQRLLDLDLSAQFQKDMLIDKKSEFEKTVRELERERAGMFAGLRAQNITDQQEKTLVDFAGMVSDGLGRADADFETRRDIIETLAAEVILNDEEGTKTLQIKCIPRQNYYVLSPNILDDLSDKPL